ncbi:MAG: 16S rRNA (cytidine(1402)-2'-O)-methyltransferase [Oscillospiraceae bacterium]
MSGILYLVGTPIGNLGDFSIRAQSTLAEVDFIAAEDTRVSIKLLNHFGIKKPLVSYYEHNRYASGAKILERLLAGESCALVTDAGMPAISDPGEDLVKLCAEAGVTVVTIPGPSAVISALAVSGIPTQRFCFEGFLSTSRKSRFEHLEALEDEPRTMIFYEAPHKLLRTLRDMQTYFGDRELSICREITKLYEETLRTTFSEAIAHFEEVPPKGEFVLVIRGAEKIKEAELTREEALTLVDRYRLEGMSLKQACKQASEDSGFSKNELYDLSIHTPEGGQPC